MAFYVDISSTGVKDNSITVLVRDLPYQSSTYARIHFYCNNGTNIRLANGADGGGTSGKYRSALATFNGLTAGTRYGFRVEVQRYSFSAIEYYPASGLIYWTTTGTAPAPIPAAPTNLRSTSTTSSSLRIAWNATTYAAGYDLQWRVGSGSWSSKVVTSTTSTLSNLSPSTQYEVRVRGYNSGYDYGLFTSTFITTAAAPIAQVTGVYSSNILQNGFRINWSSASNASSYQVAIRVRGTSAWNSSYTTSSRYYTFSGLSTATYYEIQVRGVSGSNTGLYSETFTVRTQNEKPSGLLWRVRVSGGEFNLTAKEWNDMTSKINAWRNYRDLSVTTFTTAITGRILTAAMYNQARNAIAALSPPISAPPSVSAGDEVTAYRINRICDAIDSLS